MSGIYSLLSAAKTQQRLLETTSNNIANIDTTGFKSDTAVFKQHLDKAIGVDMESEEELFNHNEFLTPYSLGSSTYAQTDDVIANMSAGAYETTEKPFDLALKGDGFFALDTPYGRRYTKNGEFHKNDEGYLVNSEGYSVLGKNGPLFVDGNHVTISSRGHVDVDGSHTDNLQIVQFDQASKMRKIGASSFVPENNSQTPKTASLDSFSIHQGILEKSNVNTVEEMVNLINVNRSYQASHNAIKLMDDIDSKTISMGRNS